MAIRFVLRAVPSATYQMNVPQILSIDNTGQKLYDEYVLERINGDVSLWDPVKK